MAADILDLFGPIEKAPWEEIVLIFNDETGAACLAMRTRAAKTMPEVNFPWFGANAERRHATHWRRRPPKVERS